MKNNKAQELIRKAEEKQKIAEDKLDAMHWDYQQTCERLVSIEFELNLMADVIAGEKGLFVVEYIPPYNTHKTHNITLAQIKDYFMKNTAFFISKHDLVLMTDEDWGINDEEIHWIGDFDGNGQGAGSLLFFLAGCKIHDFEELAKKYKKYFSF